MSVDNPDAIRVVVVDDEDFVRDVFSEYLATFPDLMLVGTCNNGADAVARVRQEPPDIFLMDIHMPVMDGVEATRAISRLNSSIRVVALTSFGDDGSVADMLDAGATGFLLKTTSPAALALAIRTAHAGQAVLSPTPSDAGVVPIADRTLPP
jgi:DNA-binding NarL/FixJ family response regulator